MERMHAGTRLERQELLGELVEDVEGALFPLALLERSRCLPPHAQHGEGDHAKHGGGVEGTLPGGSRENHGLGALYPSTASGGPPPHLSMGRQFLRRVVIGVDPPATAAGDECGIVACGIDADGVGYVLGDHSAGGLSPEQWARKAATAAEVWGAQRVVAEGNQGGEMVEAVLRGAGLRLPVRRVHARVGKSARAEPIAAFFERGEAKLAGRFPELEAQLAGLTLGGEYHGPGRSPDRADAMIWAMTELLLHPPAEPRIRSL